MKEYLNGLWKVKLDPEEEGFAEEWMKKPLRSDLTVNVPGCVQQLDCLAESYPPHDDMRNGYIGTFFMEREIELEALQPGEKYRLFIGGAAPTCYVWINGEFAAKNTMGLIAFECDITEYVYPGKNRITLAVTEQYSSLITGMRFEGYDWSGVYGQVFVEKCGSVRFTDTYISAKNGITKLCGTVTNNAKNDLDTVINIQAEERIFSFPLRLDAESKKDYAFELNLEGLPHWSYREPNLISVTLACSDSFGNNCSEAFKTGIREISTKNNRILVDGKPTLFAGAGEEYYSPMIAPLSDVDMIKTRYDAMKKYGFSYFRYHTHIPTEEELTIADEKGMMISLEFGIISNFNKLTPTDKAMEMLELYIRQTRRHPSLFIYGLGNEGSQLMIESDEECKKAVAGYNLIKNNTDNQFAIIAYGIQGEKPELHNDIETPHLWSDDFIWAYDGMTDIPWNALKETCGTRPNIVHEYGKFTVWPSPEEEADSTITGGVKPDFGTQGHEWIKRNGLEALEDRIIRNSRLSANRYTKAALEDARRQDYVSGYVLWAFFRDSWRGRGLCDDTGKITNGEEKIFKNGANADVAILIDRAFQNRAFPCCIAQKIGISVSNFSADAVCGVMSISISCGTEVIEKKIQEVCIIPGETKVKAEFVFSVPARWSGRKLRLAAQLLSDKNCISENEWDLWAFDTASDVDKEVYFHVKNLDTFRLLKKIYPNGYRLSSVDSVVIGCRSWTDPHLADTAKKKCNAVIITDVYDDVVKDCAVAGMKLVFLDSGNLPDGWMLPELRQGLGERDASRMYTSFRSSWDKGNISSVIEDDPAVEAFPNDGFCDLQFYDLIQYARPMDNEKLENIFGLKSKRIISTFAKCNPAQGNCFTVQDVNAIKALENSKTRIFVAREQGYLTRFGDHILVCSLKLSDNASGVCLLKSMVNSLMGAENEKIKG